MHGELARRLAIEDYCCSSYYLAYALCKKGVGRQHTTFTSCQNAACSIEFFLLRVDYALEGSLSKCELFLPLVLHWEVVTRILIFCGLFLVCVICPLMQEHLL